MKKLLSIIVLPTIIFTACGQPEEAPKNPIEREPTRFKEVETFSYQNENVDLFIEKLATSQAENTVSIAPETSGKITELKVKVGDQVQQGQLLATLGDSLATDTLDLQTSTARQSLNLAQLQARYSNAANNINVHNAYLQAESALNNYNLLVNNYQSTQDLFQEQLDNAQIEEENAELNQDSLHDNIDDLEDQIYDLEDDLDDAQDDDNQQLENQLEAQIEQLENQLDNLETQLDIAQNRENQAQIAINQLQINQQSQLDQLNTNIQNAEIQYQSALNQLEAAQYSTEIQNLGNQGQILQNSQNLNQLALNQNARHITATTSGIVTEVNIEEGNAVNPGQTILTIESAQESKLTVSLSETERSFINNNSKVYNQNDQEIGTITYISPSVDPQSNQYQVEIAANQKIQTGTSQTIKIKLEATNFIPLKAITIDGTNTRVKVLNAQTVNYKTIQTTEVFDTYILVSSGLNQGDKIITSNQFFLEEGEKVKELK